ncbi:MAG TPA: efflux RND transporter periplasmic adaptor subunit [Hyphomicrobiaceae bacterium]|nr:efflux RND transporter periplasmic adaptor subunit [Hyphomicrobiaceae bacterium]
MPPATTSAESTAKAAFPAVRVSVAVVEPRVAMTWSDFSGRLEAVERVEVRSRVAGAVEAVHFREGALVKEGDLLVTIDPAPYAAEVARLQAQVTAAEARVTFTRTELQRGRQLLDTRVVSPRDVDQRTNAYREAEANLQAALAALQAAQLNLGYTEVRAPVPGRVGRLEITVGNLVAAGPGAPVLTTLVSIDPIYASFAADEAVVLRALKEIGADGVSSGRIAQIPVLMETASNGGEPVRGALQLIDNQVDPNTGTVRVRAVFANPDGRLIPGQFARLRLGASAAATVVAIDERAIGTDQSKKYVLVVDRDNRAAYREVSLGGMTDGLRIVTSGLEAGERIVVNGLQHVRPGALLAPEVVAMGDRGTVQR